MSEMLDKLESQIQEIASERTAEILPLLYDRLMSRESLAPCPRHSMLTQRIRSEVKLHHAKKAMRDGSLYENVGNAKARYESVLKSTEKVREEYRSKPCNCWVEHR